MHCQRSPICFDFIRDAVRGIGTTTTSQSMDVLEDPVFTSLKRASLLRRDVINEQNVGDVTAVEFSSSKVDTTNDDHIDASDMANNYDSDNYEWEGIAIPCPPTPPPLSTQPVMFTTDQKWTVAYVCHNPHCISCRTTFAIKKAFTVHCQRSPACRVFIRDDLHGTSATTTSSHSTDVEHNATSVNNPL